jgi:hypothetical protein
VSSTLHDVPRDRVKEMEHRLLHLSGMFALTRSEDAQAEYQRLHPKWLAAKKQMALGEGPDG